MKTNESSDVYQLISFLFEYPTKEMQENLPEVREQIKSMSNEQIQEALLTFIDTKASSPIDDWCDEYIENFDFSPSTNLYITYSKQGEQRQRGMELLKIKEFYQAAGFDITDSELPDYLPLMLEFCVHVSTEKSNELLTKYVNEIGTIRDNLKEKESTFALLLDALFFQMEENGVSTEYSSDDEQAAANAEVETTTL